MFSEVIAAHLELLKRLVIDRYEGWLFFKEVLVGKKGIILGNGVLVLGLCESDDDLEPPHVFEAEVVEELFHLLVCHVFVVLGFQSSSVISFVIWFSVVLKCFPVVIHFLAEIFEGSQLFIASGHPDLLKVFV